MSEQKMSEQKSFYDRLLGDRIGWALHTAMTCDLAYVSALIDKQRGNEACETPHCAFFFDGTKQLTLICTGSPKKSVKKLSECVYELKGDRDQTHHAKISLVCAGEGKYRLAVYSKNLQFSNNIDAALLFELEKGDEPTESGNQLCKYLEELSKISDKKGKDWLDEHITEKVKEDLKQCKFISEFESEFGPGRREAEIYFGGCSNSNTNLWSLLGLDKIDESSIVLTPPIFIISQDARDFFKTKKVLYDHKVESSHIKLYLLKKGEEPNTKYELWTGSANATPHGLGWDFKKKAKGPASIECLVKLDISEEEFVNLRKEIKEAYQQYADFEKESTFKAAPDNSEPSYIINNFQCKEISYEKISYEENKTGVKKPGVKIKVTLKKVTEKTGERDDVDILSEIKWKPLEYSEMSKAGFTPDGDRFVSEYEYQGSPKRSQGYLVFGESGCLMDVSNELPVDSERVKDSIEKDIRLTNWLLNPQSIPNEDDGKWKDQLKWIRSVLKSNKLPSDINDQNNKTVQNAPCNTSTADCQRGSLDSKVTSKAEPMEFQKNGADRLYKMLEEENQSRAFLADEPGLGKTFTSAMLIDKMAEEFYKKNTDKPFYVIYVAPNKTLISKCGEDLVKKFNDISQNRKAILLSDIVPSSIKEKKESLKRAYKSYYEEKEKKLRESISREEKKPIAISKEAIAPDVLKYILAKMKDDSSYENLVADDILDRIKNGKKLPNARSALKSALGFNQHKWGEFQSKYTEIYSNYKKYYLKTKQENESKKLKKELETICQIIDEIEDKKISENLKNIRSALKKIVKEIRKRKDIDTAPRWEQLDYTNEKTPDSDRLAFVYKILPQVLYEIKNKVVIIGVSAGLLLEDTMSKKDEEDIIKKINEENGTKFKNRTEFTRSYLSKYPPNLMIWDEYHRYIEKFKQQNNTNPFFDHEKKADMKSLFVSATPYKTNISGRDNEETMKDLYAASLDDEAPDVKLPGFDDFAELFCGGKSTEKKEELIKAYNNMTENGNKNKLEELLKKRMIRNERTRLQDDYEEHIPLYDRRTQYDEVHAEILKNTANQCRLLKESGYVDGALKWSFSLPWILCFSTSRTKVTTDEGKKYTYYEFLKPIEKNFSKSCSQDLFVYDKNGYKEAKLKTLPKQNLAMHQICEQNLPDRQAAQLLWMPPTMPLYKSGEESIFTKYAGYSKLLVFAEFRYLQRGGALLLSDYARLLCKVEEPVPNEEFQLPCYEDEHQSKEQDNLKKERKNQILDELLREDRRYQTLDELYNERQNGEDKKTWLYHIASPAACAVKLNLDPQDLTDAFNRYFNSTGVKEALWSWLCDHNFKEKDKWEEGILRYCAEGNLYAVLEEWLSCMQENDPDKRTEYICSVLKREPSKAGVQTFETMKANEDGIVHNCGFAERLTGDTNDVGSGEDEDEERLCSQAFDSPFYPMILFAGRGAQEGIDLHNYCLRIMHLTLPRGAISYEQRNGRIDRYRSLLVRRRAAELVENVQIDDDTSNLIERVFAYLKENKPSENKNELYPNWSIQNQCSRWHFEELMPVWEYTEESCFADTLIEMYRSYRNSLGVNKSNSGDYIDLSTTSK